MSTLITFEDFAHRFESEFAPGYPEPLTSTTNLFDEIGLDSIAAFRMILFLEDLADVPFPPDDIPPMFLLGDAFRYYETLCAFAEGA